jgi:hypothetical protein
MEMNDDPTSSTASDLGSTRDRLTISRHERMHLTLKKEATRPPGTNSLQQQDRFDGFVHEFNAERPHEALGRSVPPSSMSSHRAAMTACLT